MKEETLAKKKLEAAQLAGTGLSTVAIAAKMGCSEKLVRKYLKDVRDTLPPLGKMTRQRLQMVMAYSDDVDLILRCVALARHYDEEILEDVKGEVNLKVQVVKPAEE